MLHFYSLSDISAKALMMVRYGHTDRSPAFYGSNNITDKGFKNGDVAAVLM